MGPLRGEILELLRAGSRWDELKVAAVVARS